MNTRIAGTVFLCLFFIAGCVSTPKEQAFFLDKLSDEEKSRIITDKGISLYKSELEGKENYKVLSEIKEYFEMALVYNPDNEDAKNYLNKINTFKATKYKEKIKTANDLLKKKKRTEDEDFKLVLAVQKAYELDPKNAEVIELRKQISALTADYSVKYVNAAKSEKDKIKPKDDPVTKYRLYISALNNCNKALQLDPENATVIAEKKSIEAELQTVFIDLVKLARDKLARNDFKGTEGLLFTCRDLNRVLLDKNRDAVIGLTYDLYFKWAKTLVQANDYDAATGLIDAALRAKKTKEATDLKDRIIKYKEENVFADSFRKSLEEIDALMLKKDYINAYDQIQVLLGKNPDEKYAAELTGRVDQIRKAFPAMYDEAVKQYKAENYKEAIKLLKVIVHIDEKYQQAKDYLDKAESRQKLLESM